MFEIIKNLILIIGTFLGIYSAPLGDAVLKVPKSDILYSNKFTDTIYDKDGKIISEIPMILYAYKSAEIAPILDNEIIEKRTEHIVTKNLGGNKRSAESGYNFYKEGTEWKQVKFATTTKEIFDKETLNPISYLIKQVFAAQTASTSPQTMADDATVGTVAWSNPTNAGASDNTYATAAALACLSVTDVNVKIVKADGTIGTTNKASGTAWSTTEAYFSYGGSSDLWGETWTATDINDADFGVVLSAKLVDGDTNELFSHYLKATNFGFSIPTGATIDGVLVEIERKKTSLGASVDHIRITVYYTEGEAGPPTPGGGIINFE